MTISFFMPNFVEKLRLTIYDKYFINKLLLDKVVLSKKYLVVNSCYVVNFRSIVVEVMQ